MCVGCDLCHIGDRHTCLPRVTSGGLLGVMTDQSVLQPDLILPAGNAWEGGQLTAQGVGALSAELVSIGMSVFEAQAVIADIQGIAASTTMASAQRILNKINELTKSRFSDLYVEVERMRVATVGECLSSGTQWIYRADALPVVILAGQLSHAVRSSITETDVTSYNDYQPQVIPPAECHHPSVPTKQARETLISKDQSEANQHQEKARRALEYLEVP